MGQLCHSVKPQTKTKEQNASDLHTVCIICVCPNFIFEREEILKTTTRCKKVLQFKIEHSWKCGLLKKNKKTKKMHHHLYSGFTESFF